MEVDAIMNMVEDSFRRHDFIINIFVSEYEITIRAVLKNT